MKKSKLLSPVFPPEDQVFLNSVQIGSIEIDICPFSGGIWFDRFELDKFDEEHEDITELLRALPPQVRSSKIFEKRRSPRHPEAVMMRQPFGPKGMNGVLTVDVCPMCAGIWLDHQEILKIRELYPTAELKKQLSQAFVDNAFKNRLENSQNQPIPNTDRVNSMFNLLSKIGKK